MNLFHVFCLIYLGLSRITCAPTDNKTTLYDAIVQKCPSVTSLPNFKEQRLFQSCNNWKKISQVATLTDDNKREVLCWLYFNAFTQYCNHIQQANTSLPTSIEKFDLNAVCDKLEVIPKQLDSTNSLHNIIKTTDDCQKLCSDEIGWVESLCSLSYYYNLQDTSTVNNSDHFIHVGKHVGQAVKETQEVENPQPPPNQESTSTDVKLSDQKTKQTTENNTNQNIESHAKAVASDQTQNQANADQSVGLKNQALATPPPQFNKGEETAAVHVEPPVVNANVDNGNSGVNPSKDKKQDPNKGTETENNAPFLPPLDVEPNVDEASVDKIPVEKTPDNDLTNDQDMGTNNEDVMQPNDRPESEEDMPEQPDIMAHDKPKPMKLDETEAVNYTTEMDGDSYFFTYFMLLCVIFIVGYVCYHNKQKILALILEGRKGKRQYRGRRPNSANYHKLDSNLEEAITSSCNKNTNNVIY